MRHVLAYLLCLAASAAAHAYDFCVDEEFFPAAYHTYTAVPLYERRPGEPIPSVAECHIAIQAGGIIDEERSWCGMNMVDRAERTNLPNSHGVWPLGGEVRMHRPNPNTCLIVGEMFNTESRTDEDGIHGQSYRLFAHMPPSGETFSGRVEYTQFLRTDPRSSIGMYQLNAVRHW